MLTPSSNLFHPITNSVTNIKRLNNHIKKLRHKPIQRRVRKICPVFQHNNLKILLTRDKSIQQLKNPIQRQNFISRRTRKRTKPPENLVFKRPEFTMHF
ncbi:hypothetical protein Hanom_Chr12g01125191 [Helianthus anomalus]